MTTKLFSDEEIEILKLNPYVEKVSSSTITYSQEFRELFVMKYELGKAPSQILREAGFEPKILGRDRIDSLSKRFRKMSQREDGMTDTRKGNSGRPATKDLSPLEEIIRLKNKIKYLEQENDFLKKIRFLDRKAQHKHDRKKSLKSSKK